MHLRKHPEFAACISTEAQLAVFTAGPRDSKAQKLALHKVFESFMACNSVPSCAFLRHRRASSPRGRAVGGFFFDFEPFRTASGPSRRVREAAVASMASPRDRAFMKPSP